MANVERSERGEDERPGEREKHWFADDEEQDGHLHDGSDVGEKGSGDRGTQKLGIGFGARAHGANGRRGGNKSTEKAGEGQTVA
jgi:hypothetical protein